MGHLSHLWTGCLFSALEFFAGSSGGAGVTATGVQLGGRYVPEGRV